MLGWFSEEIARASRSKCAVNCSRVVLMATERPNRVSRARKTSPMPTLAELPLDTVWPQALAHSQFGERRTFDQVRRVLDGRPIQEFAASGLGEKRLYFAAQFG